VSAYTDNLRTPLLLRGVISSSPAVLALSGWGYAGFNAVVNFAVTEF